VIRPALLSAAGVAAIVRAALGAGTRTRRARRLREASGGNPFYLGELLRAQSAAEPGGGRLPASEAVARHVEARIRRLDPAALGLAQALAVLGDEAQLRHAMAMTGLDTDPAVRLAAALVRVEVLAAADPPRFLHPVVRAAVDASLGSDERDRMHRAAARELDRDGAAPAGSPPT
jgi:predicted ATPase